MRAFVFFLTILTVLVPATVLADIVVIVNRKSDINALDRHQVVDIYMGRRLGLANKQELQVLDQPVSSTIRAAFYREITGKPIAAIDAYWARLVFTGRAFPPISVEDSHTMLEMVAKNPNTVGYLRREHLTQNVKVIYKLDNNN